MVNEKNNWKMFYKIASIALFMQLLVVVGMITFMSIFGAAPDSVKEMYKIFSENYLLGLFRGDMFSTILIFFYLFSYFPLAEALKDVNKELAWLCIILTYVVVVGSMITNTDFAVGHLAKLYQNASTDLEKQMLEISGNSLLANNLWNSTAAYFSGILLQGSGVIVSIMMLKSSSFRKVTAISGIIGNGLDFTQHILHLFFPDVSKIISMVMGPAYLVWFLFFALDMWKLSTKKEVLKN